MSNNKKLLNNSISGIIQFILVAILTLISVPIFINKLGIELYGVFAIVSVIGNLNILSNLGLNGALLVYVAKQGKCKESDYDFVVTLIILSIILLVFISLAIIFHIEILSIILSIPQKYISDATILFLWLLFSNAILVLGQSFTAVIDASQKIYLTNISQFVYSLIYWGGLILSVTFNGTLADIGVVAFIAAIVWFFLVNIIFFKVWGKLNLKGLSSKIAATVKKQITFGSKIYISGIIGFLFEPLSKILLSNFLGLNVVALFEIGIKIRSQINGIITKSLYPLFPFLANSINDKINTKIFDLSKKIQLFVVPAAIILVFTLTILLRYWLGNENIHLISIFVIVMSSSLLILMPPVLLIYQYLTAKNMAEKNILIQITAVIVNALSFLVLIKITGIYTILISNILAYISSFILCNYYQHKYFGANYWEERYFFFKIILFAIFCTLGCSVIRYFLPVGFWDLLIYPILVSVSFIFFVRKFELITSNDIETYFSNMPLLKIYLNRVFID